MDMLRAFFEILEEDTGTYFSDKKIWECGEEYLSYGFLTGILRIEQESIFSGLNNLTVNSVMDDIIEKLYLGKAQMTLAWMFDYAVNGCRIDVEEFYRMFLTSAYVHRFEKGNCSVVAGLSGVELTQRVIWERTPDEEFP